MPKPSNILRAGIDIGSTTAKLALLNEKDEICFSRYLKHNAEIDLTLRNILKEVVEKLQNPLLDVCVTGSAGMGVSESFQIPFVQEVTAAVHTTRHFYPDTGMLLDIGGEDSKLVYFDEKNHIDIRMNGSCAGGTGAFIEEIATLLNIPIERVNEFVSRYERIHNIACRCGVFAKTDVQNLLSDNVPKEDILASAFHAIVHQTLNTLLQGLDVAPKILMTGGPLYFFPELRKAFGNVMKLNENDLALPENPLLVSALGAAMGKSFDKLRINAEDFLNLIKERKTESFQQQSNQALFKNKEELSLWRKEKEVAKTEFADLNELKGKELFLGIDSGSTTTKIVVCDKEGRIAFASYHNNKGDQIGSVKKSLERFYQKAKENKLNLTIKRGAVVGYGEELIKAAYGIDDGFVETMAHYRAARHFDKKVSFVLDIGGQDMKAIFIQNGAIRRLEINEACSSGCGSFIETFARSFNHDVSKFAEIACLGDAPYDLGTRCTVFMNSKVKQALKEGASIENIAAGLACSVTRNCFEKVLQIRDVSELGEHIVVQGGVFLNQSVLRAVEVYLGKKVIRPDIAELMGAYGACLLAIDKMNESEKQSEGGNFIGLENLNKVDNFESKARQCKGCANYCGIKEFVFENGEKYRSGNRCEKVFPFQKSAEKKGANLWRRKYDLIFNQKLKPEKKPIAVIGIPRALNIYENFPFWRALFVESGLEIVLSSPSTDEISKYATGTMTSEHICFPAKLANGHVAELIKRKVERIFFPMIIHDEKLIDSSYNSYTCPVVCGYPELLRSAVNPALKGVPFDSLAFSFKEPELLKKRCFQYLKNFKVPKKRFNRAFQLALKEMVGLREKMKLENTKVLEKARSEKQPSIMLMGKPYHLDPLINHNVPEIISGLGFNVLTEDIADISEEDMNKHVLVISQWESSNRSYNAAKWVREEKDIHPVILNSFGCGVDAISIDETRSILDERGSSLLTLRVDEMTSAGSLKLRLRSMLKSLGLSDKDSAISPLPRKTTPVFKTAKDAKTILICYAAPFYMEIFRMFFQAKGYNCEILPLSDQKSIETGLRYVNNDMCYPNIAMVGDIIKALDSGKYDLNNTAVCMSQTSGMCRLTNYTAIQKKALIDAGYNTVPVVTLPFGVSSKQANEQPGFDELFVEMKSIFFPTLLYMDQLTKIYYATAAREKKKGASLALLNKHISYMNEDFLNFSSGAALELLEKAVKSFNEIDTDAESVRGKIGVIGEIYTKQNPFSNNDLANWMMNQGMEVIIPPLLPAIMQGIIDVHTNHKTHIIKTSLKARSMYLFYERLFNRRIKRSNNILKNFRHEVIPLHTIREIAQKAEKIISLNMQAGDSWTIPGDVALLSEAGVNKIVCLSPFGCLATHIVAKGMRREMRRVYPDLNILYLDIDPGSSKVNIFNRLHLFLQT